LKNNYRINNETAVIEVSSKGVTYEVLIDIEDIDKIGNRTVGIVANGYSGYRSRGKATYLHRLLTNCPAGKIVDHINGNKYDNRKENLRVCTHKENNRNIANKYDHGKSGVRNVHWNDPNKCWTVKITVNNKTINIGSTKDIKEAEEMAKKARREHWSC
jgi:HNH endonuclease